MEEIWSPVSGFPDYAVSNYGEVLNVKRNTLLNPRKDSYGALRVRLYRGATGHDKYVHHLVAEAFISGYKPGVYIRHYDKDKSNNYVMNLRFPQDVRMGHLYKRHPRVTRRHIRVVETGEVFRTVRDCARFHGLDISSIYAVLRDEREHYRGYTFEWVELE